MNETILDSEAIQLKLKSSTFANKPAVPPMFYELGMEIIEKFSRDLEEFDIQWKYIRYLASSLFAPDAKTCCPKVAYNCVSNTS